MEIPKARNLEQKVFAINNDLELVSIALEVYHFQFENNLLYGDYCKALGRTPATVHTLVDIPFLPISFFKTHRVETTAFDPELVFKSSGTTGMTSSQHLVRYAAMYRKSFRLCFERFYGSVRGYCVLGLLPSYLERGQSSLVYMVDDLIRQSNHADSGFYLNDLERLHKTIKKLEEEGQKTLLIGVTYALLDFAALYPQPLQHTIVMETGGMKGRHREMIRSELYEVLKTAFGLSHIHSEYGMTELLSQAYALDGRFQCPPWMKVLPRDETDPLSLVQVEKTVSGALNVVDLANLYSCSFIATEDVGRFYEEDSFEVLGRMDYSDVRGCSLMTV